MFTTPLGLLGLLALPAILAVHLFKRRFQPRTVSALFLWAAVSADPAAGRRREPLRRSASLILELLAALLLTLALAGPRWGGAGEPPYIVAIVDGTASMGAVDSSGSSGLSRAKKALTAAVDGLPGNARVTLIRTGPSPEVIVGPAAFKVEAAAAIGDLTAPHPGHDLGAAWDLAIELSRAAGALFITDRPGDAPVGLPEAAGNIETIGVGAPLANVGFVNATRSAQLRSSSDQAKDTDELQLVVRSFSGATETRSLELLDGATGASMGGEQVTLLPNSSLTRRYSVPASAGPITCRIGREGGDPLAVDDEAYLCPPPRRHLRVAAEISDQSARALGLGSGDSAAERWASILGRASAVASSGSGAAEGSPHLVLTEGPTHDLDRDAGTWLLRLGPVTGGPAAAGAEGEPIHLASPYLIDKAHPLMEGVTLDGVVWTAGGALSSLGIPLVYSGNLVLAVELETEAGAREWRFDIDPARSTLGRSPDWPILLTNAAEARRAELPGPVRTSLSAGEPFHWRGAADGQRELDGPEGYGQGQPWILKSPSGNEEPIEPIPGGDLVTRGMTEAGVWTLLDGNAVRAKIGVSLMSPGESDLTGGATRGDVQRAISKLSAISTGEAAGSSSPWTLWLGILALAAIAANWWVLQSPTRSAPSAAPSAAPRPAHRGGR